MCWPTFWTWTRGTDAEKRAADVDGIESIEDFIMSQKDSPFPCEAQEYLDQLCVNREYTKSKDFEWQSSMGTYGTASKEVIEAERACICPSKHFELVKACSRCEAAHGAFGQKWLEEAIAYQDLVERMFCNETVPALNLYFVERSLYEDLPARDTGVYSDKFPGRTEVSIYYTSGVQPQKTDTWFPDSIMTETMDSSELDATTSEPFTRASTFAVTPTVDLPGATSTSTAAADELKAAGGIVMAMLGAMVML